MEQTIIEYYDVIEKAKAIFIKKCSDYGLSWKIMRTSSITDQIYIKATRIRTIQELENSSLKKVSDSISSEFIGIINYGIIANISLSKVDVSEDNIEKCYDDIVANCVELLKNKNHDYGEVWRNMRISSITDLILMKIFRIKQIEDNNGVTIISEGLNANYEDIINYAIFCLILTSYNQ